MAKLQVYYIYKNTKPCDVLSSKIANLNTSSSSKKIAITEKFVFCSSDLYLEKQLDRGKMAHIQENGNVFLEILDSHGNTLQQLAQLSYLCKGEEAKPFFQAITAAKVNRNLNQIEILI